MRTFARLVMFCSLTGGIHSAAFACGASYDPATRAASVPCFDVAAEGRSSGISLQGSGANAFAISTAQQFTLADPVIAEVRILSTPTPTAIVTGFYRTCGGGSVSTPTITRTGSSVDIRVKMRVAAVPDFACEARTSAVQPFAEAVRLFSVSNPATQSYSVNGKPVEPVF
jgi:hypothetical protein